MITRTASIALVAVAGLSFSASGQQIVVPNALAAVEGGTSNSFPFSAFTPVSQRYQQVYAASDFGALTGPTPLTQLRFRPNATSTFTPWSNTATFEVRFSVTPTAPDALSTTFATNVGAGETVVYSGSATISTGQSGPVTGPLNFDVILTLQTPFVYNPASGNLLMDVKREGTSLASSRFLDAHNVAGDPISRVVSVTNSSDVTGTATSFGLVTQFVFTPPTPSCYADCDHVGGLTGNDFQCFLNAFVASESYADCDGVGGLTGNDFQCFLDKFVAGCS